MIQPAFEILNQRGTPMFFSDVLANRPTAGIVGRIFIATDSPYGIFRDTGSGWDQIAGSGGGGISGSGAAGQVTFWTGASAVSGSNNLFFDNASGKFLVGTNNTAGAAKLQVTSSTGDDHIRVWGTTSPSIRIDNAVSGATQRFVMGLATATNNFIQGSAAGDICISTASANPLLFGMWQTTNASEVMRISTANNLLIGTTTDAGFKVDVSGTLKVRSIVEIGNTTNFLTFINNRSSLTDYLFRANYGVTNVMNLTFDSFGFLNMTGANFSAPSMLVSTNLQTNGSVTFNGNNKTAYWVNVTDQYVMGMSGNTFVIRAASSSLTTGGALVSTSFVNGNITFGGSVDAGFKVDVQGTSRYNLSGISGAANGFLIYNGSTNNLRVLGNGEIRIGGSTFEAPIFQAFNNSAAVDLTGYNVGFSSVSNNSQTTSSGGFFNVTGLTNTIASGHYNNSLFIRTFAPTSGTATFTNLHLRQTINQTGGANGITRGLHIQPTLTAAADWRSFEFDNSTGWGIYGSGAAPNYVNGNFNIGSTSNPGQKLYVNGAVRIDGQTAATAGGSAGLHLILNLDGTNYKIALLNV